MQYWITPDILKGETEKDEHLIGEPDLDDGEFEALEDSSETDESATIDQDPVESPISNSDLKQVGAQIDHILQTITNQFVEKLDQRNEVIHSLQSELQQKRLS